MRSWLDGRNLNSAIDADLWEAAVRASAYLRTIALRRVAPADEAVARLEQMRTAFPETAASTAEIIQKH